MQEEICLREIIETIWDGKWIIAAVTAVAVLVAGVYSFFIVKPTYEATAMVRFAGNNESQDTMLNSFSETTRSAAVIQRILTNLNLEEQGYTVSEVSKAVQVQSIKGTSIIELSVKDRDPATATLLANMLAQDLGVRTIINDLATKIVQAKNSLIQLQDREKVVQSELDEIERLLAVTPEKLETSKALAEESYLHGVVSELSNQGNLSSGTLELKNEEVNPVYIQLKSRLAEKQLEMANIQASMNNLQRLIEENEGKINQLEARSYFEEEVRMIQTRRLLEGDYAVFITPALEPSHPVSGNKILNILIGAVVGGVISVMIVFFRHYWRISGPVKQTS